MPGIRAKLVVDGADGCPVVAASATTDGPATDVTWTATDGETTVEQVTMAPTEGTGDGTTRPGPSGDCDQAEFRQVFDYGSRQVYEFERENPEPCVCERIEETVGPVTDVRAVDGALHVTVHAAAVDSLRDVVAELRTETGGVRIEYLVRSRTESNDSRLVPVDLERLTARQREVLERAYELGYFEYPRDANAAEVAESLGIGSSTFVEHLNTAQSKLLSDLLRSDPD
jgi:DNA-binding CsgD family transcriptional regulator